VAFFDHGTVFPGWAAMIPVFGSALLIAGTTSDEQGVVRRLLASKPMVVVGLLSYSWYLWHWPLLSVYRVRNLGVQDIPANAMLILVALLLAWATYVWIENPIRVRRPGPFRSIRPTLMVGLGIALVTFLMGTGLRLWVGHQKHRDAYRDVQMALGDHSPYQKKCNVSSTRPVTELRGDACVFGSEAGQAKVLLWGDSHADHLMPMLTGALPAVGVYQLTMTGCVPVPGYEMVAPTALEICADFNRRVLDRILELKTKGLQGVVISARWPAHLWHPSISVAEHQPSPPSAQRPAKMAEVRAALQASLGNLLDLLERNGLRVLVVAPTPELVYSAPMCLGFGKGALCNVPRPLNDNLLADPTAALAEVVSRHPNARLAQVADFFCDKEVCFAARDGKILYVDDDHITATTSRDLGHFLQADLDWVSGK
jgi:hypothetical protein